MMIWNPHLARVGKVRFLWNAGVFSQFHLCAGCRVQGSGCRVEGAGWRVQGAGLRVQREGSRVQGGGCNQ